MRILLIAALAASGCAFADIGPDDQAGLENVEFQADNGIFLDNGLNLANGMNLGNGTTLHNGMNLGNGIDLANGMNLGNGIYAPPSGSGLEQWIDVDPPMRKKILRYLVECALPSGVAVQLTYRGQRETLAYGVAGLGPSLQAGLMRGADQERVTACMLARMNGSGRTVQIDLFGPMGVGGFDSTSASDGAYPVLEGAFFGNLFASSPTAQACQHYPYALADMRSCRDLGGGAYDCGILEFTGDLCSTQGNFDGYSQCDEALTDGPEARVYYTNCAGGEVSWQYVLTTYLARKASGQPCFGHEECASATCDPYTLVCQ